MVRRKAVSSATMVRALCGALWHEVRVVESVVSVLGGGRRNALSGSYCSPSSVVPSPDMGHHNATKRQRPERRQPQLSA
eukprot:7286557-Prymnesium_polylepis.1